MRITHCDVQSSYGSENHKHTICVIIENLSQVADLDSSLENVAHNIISDDSLGLPCCADHVCRYHSQSEGKFMVFIPFKYVTPPKCACASSKISKILPRESDFTLPLSRFSTMRSTSDFVKKLFGIFDGEKVSFRLRGLRKVSSVK